MNEGVVIIQSTVDPLGFSTCLSLVCRHKIEILEKENLVLVVLNTLKVPITTFMSSSIELPR